MKWLVQIPPPKAKRLTNRKLIVLCSDGWDGAFKKEIVLHSETEFTFEVPDEREWCHNTNTIDGPLFDVLVESCNSTGSRKEVVHLVPQKIQE